MIRTAIDQELQSFIDFLNHRYPTERDAVIVVLPGYDSVEVPGGGSGWACYDPQTCVLWIPGEMPKIEELTPDECQRIHYEHIAHEFIHHVQNCEGREFDEDEAETRAHEIVEAWLERGSVTDDLMCWAKTATAEALREKVRELAFSIRGLINVVDETQIRRLYRGSPNMARVAVERLEAAEAALRAPGGGGE